MMVAHTNGKLRKIPAAELARAKPAGRWVWDPNAPAPKSLLTQMKEAAAASQQSNVPAARKSKARTTASRAKPRPACRFAHLNAVRPGDLAAAVRAVREDSRGAAPSRATVYGFSSSKRAAAFVVAAMQRTGAARPSDDTPEAKAAFILAAAAKARPNRNGA